MAQKKITLLKYYVLFSFYGWIYLIIEILYRGRSHWSMFFLAGLCGTLVGQIDENGRDKEIPLWIQMCISVLIVTYLEFLTGVFVNLVFRLDVWDYSDLPLNIYGQICPYFSLAWFFLSLPIIFLDNKIRERYFGEPTHVYIGKNTKRFKRRLRV